MRDYLLHMMTYEPRKTVQRESLVCDVAIIIIIQNWPYKYRGGT